MRSDDMGHKNIVGYIFSAIMIDAVRGWLKEIRKKCFKRICYHALSEHFNVPCHGLFETPIDHYHLIVYYTDCPKPTDTTFHRRFYQFMSGKEWKSNTIRSERGMMQYIMCEPRRIVELSTSANHYKFLTECWETRHEQQAKIQKRDEKKAAEKDKIKQSKVHPKICIADDDDWWLEHNCNPQVIINACTTNAIRDVSAFLNWMKEYHPDRTMGSFVFHREKPRLEKEINMEIRRYRTYSLKNARSLQM